MTRRKVGILVFPDVEVLDFCGPFEVFSVTRLDENRRRLDLGLRSQTLDGVRPGHQAPGQPGDPAVASLTQTRFALGPLVAAGSSIPRPRSWPLRSACAGAGRRWA